MREVCTGLFVFKIVSIVAGHVDWVVEASTHKALGWISAPCKLGTLVHPCGPTFQRAEAGDLEGQGHPCLFGFWLALS